MALEKLNGWTMYSYGTGWSLPSISAPCLSLKFYLAFLGYRVGEEACKNRRMVPEHADLPALAQSSSHEVKWGLYDIVEWLGESGIGTPVSQLPPDKKAKTVALAGLMEAVLSPALEYNWIAEPLNFPIVSRAYSNHLSFPVGLVDAALMKKRSLARLEALGCVEGAAVYGRAAQAYETLAVELGSKPYLLGTEPSYIDALVLGHLALALHAPMDPQASNLMVDIQKFPNLVDYTTRCLRQYLRNSPSRLQSPLSPPLSHEIAQLWSENVKPALITSAPVILGSGLLLAFGIALLFPAPLAPPPLVVSLIP